MAELDPQYEYQDSTANFADVSTRDIQQYIHGGMHDSLPGVAIVRTQAEWDAATQNPTLLWLVVQDNIDMSTLPVNQDTRIAVNTEIPLPHHGSFYLFGRHGFTIPNSDNLKVVAYDEVVVNIQGGTGELFLRDRAASTAKGGFIYAEGESTVFAFPGSEIFARESCKIRVQYDEELVAKIRSEINAEIRLLEKENPHASLSKEYLHTRYKAAVPVLHFQSHTVEATDHKGAKISINQILAFDGAWEDDMDEPSFEKDYNIHRRYTIDEEAFLSVEGELGDREIDRIDFEASITQVGLRENRAKDLRDLASLREQKNAEAQDPEKAQKLREESSARLRAEKESLVAEAEALAESEDWEATTQQFTALKMIWKETAVTSADWEQPLNNRFHAAYEAFYRRHPAVLEEAIKTVAEAEALSASDDWFTAAKRFEQIIVELQGNTNGSPRWSPTLRERFRAAYVTFLDRFDAEQKKFITEVEELAESTDWEVTKKRFSMLKKTKETISWFPGDWGIFDSRFLTANNKFVERENAAKKSMEQLVIEAEALALSEDWDTAAQRFLEKSPRLTGKDTIPTEWEQQFFDRFQRAHDVFSKRYEEFMATQAAEAKPKEQPAVLELKSSAKRARRSIDRVRDSLNDERTRRLKNSFGKQRGANPSS